MDNKLVKIATDFEKEQIYNTVLRLFLFQGKKTTEQEILVWVEEIISWGYNIEKVLSVIEQLKSEKLFALKLSDIKNLLIDKSDISKTEKLFTEMDRAEYGSNRDREFNLKKISKLKEIYDKRWFYHFNDKKEVLL